MQSEKWGYGYPIVTKDGATYMEIPITVYIEYGGPGWTFPTLPFIPEGTVTCEVTECRYIL
jgi:hypothetical protein